MQLGGMGGVSAAWDSSILGFPDIRHLPTAGDVIKARSSWAGRPARAHCH